MFNKVYSVSNNLGVENKNKNLHDVPYCKIVKLNTWMYCINNLILFQIIVILKEVHLENIGRENQYGKTANNTV